jgi:hypothetical protein
MYYYCYTNMHAGTVSILNYALYSTGTVYLRLTIVNTAVLSTVTSKLLGHKLLVTSQLFWTL